MDDENLRRAQRVYDSELPPDTDDPDPDPDEDAVACEEVMRFLRHDGPLADIFQVAAFFVYEHRVKSVDELLRLVYDI